MNSWFWLVVLVGIISSGFIGYKFGIPGLIGWYAGVIYMIALDISIF